jgi:hypothetical protein
MGYVVNTAGEHPTFVFVMVNDDVADMEAEHPPAPENPFTAMPTVGAFNTQAGLGDGLRVTETDDEALIDGVRDEVKDLVGLGEADAPHNATTVTVEVATGKGSDCEVVATDSAML